MVDSSLRHFSSTLYGAYVCRISGMHGEMCYELLCDSNTLSGAALRCKAPSFEWYLQLSQLNPRSS
jgi:hypothetical protein